MFKKTIFYLFLVHSFVYAEFNSGVLDEKLHLQNQLICQKVITERLNVLKTLTVQEQAKKLSHDIYSIAQELLTKGFNLQIYSNGVSKADKLFYAAIPLWEGQNVQPHIPLTLFIYSWPPENYAKQCQTPYLGYSTPIHSHPISCAFTVLRGKLVQELFVPLKNLRAKKIKQEILQPGQVIFDEPSSSFVHRMVCQDEGKQAALSLHAYGASTAYQAQEIFRLTASQYNYISFDLQTAPSK